MSLTEQESAQLGEWLEKSEKYFGPVAQGALAALFFCFRDIPIGEAIAAAKEIRDLVGPVLSEDPTIEEPAN